MAMRSWLQKIFPKAFNNTKVVYRHSSHLTVERWRTVPELVKKAQRVLYDADTRMIIDAMRNTHLQKGVLDGMPSPDVRAIIQAQIEGYTMALNDLESLAVFKKPDEPLEETFEKPEQIE